ncbi:Hpt domain-containing protein [Achromobacter sp. HZ01]|uniref:Hpt domain-containing protein n=1 Tax=Achromobacter sp. HZ01 TaxID=1416886 RepID=UPI000DD0806E|nr:Hpt domain-containing protein [Achromobacter sp. HZ01]
MNLALVIGSDPGRMRELCARLENLGLVVESCPDVAAMSGYSATPRVVVWDGKSPQASAALPPAAVGEAPIRLWIAPSGSAIADDEAYRARPIADSELLPALLSAGYCLPDDRECAAISAVLHGLVDGDAAVVAELVDSLADTGLNDLAGYRACCASRDWHGAGALAHRIKGTARLAGCASLTRLCEHIEAVTRSGDGAEVERLNTLFVPALERLCAELHRLRQGR